MYKILFIWAMPWEVNVIKKKIKEIWKNYINTDFLIIWMWNYETIYNLTNYLYNNTPDFIVNIWVCWYKENKSDLIQVIRTFNFWNKKESLIPIFFSFSKLESIFCSEEPIFDNKILIDENYVDMESYWVEFVCDRFKIPRIILKVPTDQIWIETEFFDKDKALKFLWENINYEKLLNEVILYLDKLPKKDILDKYFGFYNMTFSEKNIFEKLYNEYKIFSKNSFYSFFENNRNLCKKDFLEKFSNK